MYLPGHTLVVGCLLCRIPPPRDERNTTNEQPRWPVCAFLLTSQAWPAGRLGGGGSCRRQLSCQEHALFRSRGWVVVGGGGDFQPADRSAGRPVPTGRHLRCLFYFGMLHQTGLEQCGPRPSILWALRN